MGRRLNTGQGFTLIELMVVVAIVGVLALIAVASYRHFTAQAKAVEAEVALAEVHRLEVVYYANHGVFTNDFNALGFSLAPSLKYYSIQIQVLSGGAAYDASALPLIRDPDQVGLLLRQTPDGRVVITKTNAASLAAQTGSAVGGDGDSNVSAMGSGGTAGSTPKLSCKEGGEATVAADGLLDMNFCLK